MFALEKKLPRMNPGVTWVEWTHVGLCGVSTNLPGLIRVNSAHLQEALFTLQKATLDEPELPWVTFFSANRALVFSAT